MKLTFLLTFLLSINLSARVYSQDVKLNLKLENVSIEKMISEINRITGVRFIYNSNDIKGTQNISIDTKNSKISEILDKTLVNNNLTYELYENTIVIKKEKQSAQDKKITILGKVTDQDGQALPGATIRIKGTSIGTATDMDGKYKISVTSSNTILVFSFIGMKSQEVKIGKNQNINIKLLPDSEEIDEVVVTGIFDKPRESYTGAVSTISSAEIKEFKGQNLLQTLQNIDPSLNIALDNEAGSNPNHLPSVTIRGSSSIPIDLDDLNSSASQQLNTPLVIMDGFEVSLQKLMDFNDEEIRSINILKDASATAIYGSRGANGVIVIITKAPQAGKLKVNFLASYNFSIPDLSSYNLMNAREKLETERLAGIYSSAVPTEKYQYKQKYNDLLSEVNKGVNTDWISQPVRVGLGQRYNTRLEGGSNQFKWSTSIGLNKIAGAMKDSERNIFSGSITLSYTYKNLIFKNQTYYTITKANNGKYGSFSSYAKMNPYYRIYDEDGNMIKSYPSAFYGTLSFANPLYNTRLNIINKNETDQIKNNLSVDWKIMESLRLRTRLGISKSNNTSDYYLPPDHTRFDDYDEQNKTLQKGSYTYGTGEKSYYNFSLTLSYAKTIKKLHQIYAGINYNVTNRDSQNYSFSVEGFTNSRSDFLSNALQYKEGGKANGYESKTRSIGFTGNINYTYDNKYFIDGSFRMDGSSQFGSNKRFAPFGSIGVGYNMHNEDIIKDLGYINQLRIKASYGTSGSQQFSAYQAISSLKYYSTENYLNWNGAYLMGLGNKDLKWQKTDQINLGIELGLINRIHLEFNVYKKTTSNLLSSIELPYANGFSSYVANIGKVQNTGFETTLRYQIIKNSAKDIMWNVTTKIAHNKNKIVKLSESLKRQTEENIAKNVEINNLLFEGQSQYAIYAVKSLGIDPSNGQELFLTKDGEITNVWRPKDKVYAGVSQPKYRGNVNSIFRYKNISLNLSFGYYFGGQQYNTTLLNKVEVPTYSLQYNNFDKRVLKDRWTKIGDIKQFKAFGGQATKTSTRFVQDDDVLKLQSASITYRLKPKFTKSIKAINLTLNTTDLFYLSTIKRERGTSYPFARTMGFSISLLF